DAGARRLAARCRGPGRSGQQRGACQRRRPAAVRRASVPRFTWTQRAGQCRFTVEPGRDLVPQAVLRNAYDVVRAGIAGVADKEMPDRRWLRPGKEKVTGRLPWNDGPGPSQWAGHRNEESP